MENKNLAKRIRELMWNKMMMERSAEEAASTTGNATENENPVALKHDMGYRDISKLMDEEDEARKVLEAAMNGVVKVDKTNR